MTEPARRHNETIDNEPINNAFHPSDHFLLSLRDWNPHPRSDKVPGERHAGRSLVARKIPPLGNTAENRRAIVIPILRRLSD
ncbi:MAG: hypothetical protein P8Y71_04540 [Pseudolabrys sp.]